MHGVFAFSSTNIGFPGFPCDFPFAFLGCPLGASFGFGELTAAATEGVAGEAIAGPAGVFALVLSFLWTAEGLLNGSRIHIFTLLNQKLLQLPPKIIKLPHD